MVSKPEYNSLQDGHLAHHFRKPVVFRHLLCMGLVTPEGKVLTEREWKNSQRIPFQEDLKTPRLLSLASEGNLRPPIGKSTESTIRNKRRKFSTKKEICLPFPFFAKRKGVAGEPYLDSLTPFRNHSKVYSIRSARGTQITKCSQVWERLCPPPNYNISISSWRRTPPTPAYFKLQYIGKIDPIKVLILQQPSGVNSVTVFSGTIHPQEEFSFTSCRAREAAFSLVIYEDDLCTSRVNTCCERRYYQGRKIGGPGGHFLVTEMKGGIPCNKCESAMPVDSMKTFSNGSYRKAIGTKITIDVQLAESDSERSGVRNKEKLKQKSMDTDDSKGGKDEDYTDSQNTSPSDLKSGTDEDTDDDTEGDKQTSEAASENDGDVNYTSNGTHSESGTLDNSDVDSQASEISTSEPSSEHSEDENELQHEDESNKSIEEDLSKKTESNNDDYSSDFTSSHSTIKDQVM